MIFSVLSTEQAHQSAGGRSFSKLDFLTQMIFYSLALGLVLSQAVSHAETSASLPENQNKPPLEQQISNTSEIPVSNLPIQETQEGKEAKRVSSFLLNVKGDITGIPPIAFNSLGGLSLEFQAPVIMEGSPLKFLVQGGAGGGISCLPTAFIEGIAGAIAEAFAAPFSGESESSDESKSSDGFALTCFMYPYADIDIGLSYALPFWRNTTVSLKGGVLFPFSSEIEEAFKIIPKITLSIGWKIAKARVDLGAVVWYKRGTFNNDYSFTPLPNLSVTFPLKKW